MAEETRKSIETFVDKWMKAQEPDTFIKNDRGNYIYSAGPSSINLKIYFCELLEEFIESKS